ncbi:probable BOI-related E3 ubiquitin-protein ligase 3 [Telopea speciosissima]|uniref:probable BOI-related E3 ubiquitin-protein ligase 3 n=1 Tax=Telopea speciosissima TaxID=54955 RepID=UPI001CC38883|nr:probable BOI-related E3 ubiquitin-protein ligase 3 [Telopea speciosissima]
MAIQAQQYPENLGFTLCGIQETMNSSGGFYDLYLNLQQQERMQQLQNINLLRNYNLGFENNPLVSSSSSSSSQSNPLSMAFSESLAADIDKQALEIDRYILLQNERLRLTLQEQRKHQMAILFRMMESKTVSLLRQKDEDIARAAKRTMELEECLKRAEMENQAWQRVTKEKESMVMALNNTLEQVKENNCYFLSAGAEESESCCDISQAHYRDEKEEEEKEPMRKMACKACNFRRSCVLFLPCRHLCSCKSCVTVLDSCPVCNSPKKASMEVLML